MVQEYFQCVAPGGAVLGSGASHGDLLGFRASNRDITKRKCVEEREGVYRKMVYDRENRLIGAVMLGDTSDLAEVTRTTSEPAKEP
jgi:NAD(P)H-nitrite reductase large subunit